MQTLSHARLSFVPTLPRLFNALDALKLNEVSRDQKIVEEIEKILPKLCSKKILSLVGGASHENTPQRVGVVFSGGQAAGGHNVIIGLYDALKKIHPESTLIGFLNGPSGILKNESIALTAEKIAPYRNQGGFDMIGSGRTKIETPEQFQQAAQVVSSLHLDGLVIIGGDDSNTNAALLAEYFLQHNISTTVVGVPKTIDGDLKNEYIEVSFGFDTATKTYAALIGDVMRDALSAKKYWFFIKLMGRSASHITLECALQTHPNYAMIGEEKKSLAPLVNELASLVIKRAEKNKNFGVVLIPEGIIEFIPEFQQLIKELNVVLSDDVKIDAKHLLNALSKESGACFAALPPEIQSQLLLDRDPHGNVQVSKIETERLFIALVKKELEKRGFQGAFNPQPLFYGYEGRSCLPSNFDAQYCNALGYAAAVLINARQTGYMACIKNLSQEIEEWQPLGVPLPLMMGLENRKGKMKPVITKALVDLNSESYKKFAEKSSEWSAEDNYLYPGPIQFYGPKEITDRLSMILSNDGEFFQ